MKYIVSLLSVLLFLNGQSLEYKGSIGFDYKNFDYLIANVQDTKQKTFLGEMELINSFDNFMFFTKIEALKDVDNNDRKYIKLNELYIKYESDDYDVKLGRDIKYWGALELHNLTDVYNEKNIQNDAYDKNKKLGRDGMTYTYFKENEDEVSFIINKEKTEKNDISVYVKYSGSRNDIASRDFSYILSSVDEKLMMFHTVVNNNTIYKLEYLYANKTKKYQLGMGLEHTLYNVFTKKDLGFMFEYYKSNITNTKYEKSIFAGTRVTFNDISNSDIIMGVIKDDIKEEYSYSVEYNTRVYDKFKTKLSYLENDNLKVVGINIAYNF